MPEFLIRVVDLRFHWALTLEIRGMAAPVNKRDFEKEKGNMMKKILATLVVLALAMPALAADVDFDAVDNGDGSFTITYTATTAPRGLALSIDTATVAIVDASAATGTDAAFNCFMDEASEDPENYVLGAGSPLAADGAAGLPAFPASEFSLCMGVLDASQGAGPLSATVATVLTNLPEDATVTVTISEDSFRGGVVGDAALTTNLPITVTVTNPGASICVGDLNGDGYVDGGDIPAFIAMFGSADGDGTYSVVGDFNEDGYVDGGDVPGLIAAFGSVCP